MKKINYTKTSINIIALIITVAVYTILNYIYVVNKIEVAQEETYQNSIEAEIVEEKSNWTIEIPKIEVNAEIEEGTEENILEKYVGHYEETSKTTGNIGLIAYSKGHEKNYFEDLKKLEEGDEIIYKYEEFQKTYIVDVAEIIVENDLSYLEPTEENKITLITSINNEPKYRRCVQAVEKQE